MLSYLYRSPAACGEEKSVSKVHSIWLDGFTLFQRCKTKGRSQGNGECLCSLKVCEIRDINNAHVPDGTEVIMNEAM